jgi:hypothetical protein
MTRPPPTSASPSVPPPHGHVDGNAAAGALAEIFGRDITAAVGTCGSCGRRAAVAQCHAYLGGPGGVLRCAGCDHLLLRWAATPHTTWLEMPGLRGLGLANE